jgi:hypothetical protein
MGNGWMDGNRDVKELLVIIITFILFYIEERKLNKKFNFIFFSASFFLCFVVGHDWCIIKLGKNETI